MTSLGAFFGRLHLVFLHLPIGFLFLAGVLAVLTFRQKTGHYRPALDLAVLAGAIAAVLSAGCGWLLSNEGGYDEVLLQRHQWLGFTAAALAGATWFLRHSRWYFGALALAIAAITMAGHFGGSLTHGEGYLTETLLHKTEQAGPGEGDIKPGATAYEAFIQPIFEKKCVSCHNPKKKKGELLLDTKEGLLAGGKHGIVVKPGKPDSSELYRRINLPGNDEDRMPPRGKLPLSAEEIAMVRQWIELGADFTIPATAMQASAMATEQTVSFPPVLVKAADPDAIDLLRQNRISVMSMGRDVPWLSVSVAGKKDLDATKLDLLKKVKNQVVHLDCSHSNVDDRLMPLLAELPNLTRLNLSGTAVSDEGLKHLKGLQFLDYLNITNTAVGDASLEILASLPALRSLYTWNSRISPQGLQQLQSRQPALHVDSGAPSDSSAAPLQLRPPKILYARNIFEDTVRVTLDFPFKTVGLFYTLDQASPTTQSYRYKGEPLVISESATLRVIAAKEGWENSPPVQASFVRRKWTPQSATLATPPSPKYPGDGAASLTDGKIGEVYTEKTFIGYEGEHLTAILDFGNPIDFHRLSVHYAENNGSWVFAPHGLRVWTSGDGKNWSPSIHAQYPVPAGMQETRAAILSEAAPKPVRTRYLKVTVESLLKNPKWHPGAGQKCWVFVDEVLVE